MSMIENPTYISDPRESRRARAFHIMARYGDITAEVPSAQRAMITTALNLGLLMDQATEDFLLGDNTFSRKEGVKLLFHLSRIIGTETKPEIPIIIFNRLGSRIEGNKTVTQIDFNPDHPTRDTVVSEAIESTEYAISKIAAEVADRKKGKDRPLSFYY